MGRLKQSTLRESSGITSQKATTQEDLTNINVKIPKQAKQWLTTQAQQIRDNNSSPVPPNERVYPQHLIQTAIELLCTSEVDWGKVKNLQDLRKQLNL